MFSSPVQGQGSDELREQIRETKSKLKALPKTVQTLSPWTIGMGYAAEQALHEVSFEVAYESAEIDLVVLMPLTYSDRDHQIHPLCFPKRFKIELILDGEVVGVLADYSEKDYVVKGVEPQIFPVECAESREAASTAVRVTITKFTENPIWWHHPYFAGFSELYAFSGEQNVALNAQVMELTGQPANFGYTYAPACLVDGFTMFSPLDWNISSSNDGFMTVEKAVSLVFDLGEEKVVDEFRVWPLAIGMQENFTFASGTNFPRQVKLEVLGDQTSDEGELLYESEGRIRRPGNSPLMKKIAPTKGRYFRLSLSDPFPDFRVHEGSSRLALSEFELLGEGKVLTRGREPRVVSEGLVQKRAGDYERSDKLIDGRTAEGEIISLKNWLTDFAERAELERSLVTQKKLLDHTLIRERHRLQIYVVVSFAVIGLLVLLVWVVRLLGHQRWLRMREQISADLHDEIGANLTSISHTTQLLAETIPEPTDFQEELLERADSVARNTAMETRSFIQFLQAKKTGDSLTESIQRMARQILGSLDYEFQMLSKGAFAQFNPHDKWDVFLFVKEALHNAAKHAEAKRVILGTSRCAGGIEIWVQDDGVGIPSSSIPPKALARRAKQLGGELEIKSSSGEGTHVSLILKNR